MSPDLRALAAPLLEHQAPSGAFPACPTFSQYPYSWLRDSTFIAYALDRAGEHAASGRYYRWAAQTIAERSEQVSALVALRQRGEAIPEHAFLPCRFALNGEALDDGWPNFQLDGYGQWLWGLGEHLRAQGLRAMPEVFRPGVEVTLAYLKAFWREPCYDCWEEFPYRWHTSTLASLAAGLRAMQPFMRGLEPVTADVLAFIRDHLVQGGQLVKFAGYPDVDASLLWVAVPFGVLAVDDPVYTRTVQAIEQTLLRGGVHRYARDTYYGGGSWVLLTAWLGWVYARQGRPEEAHALLGWIRDQNRGRGLPEQTTDGVLNPVYVDYWRGQWGESARPLLWSHAMHLILEAEVAAHASPLPGVPS
ncbi:glycoside hydrolase family 15 protein [Deinococcus sp. KSM4-11]|uniref:glycoside hydrolase family 15 protein n=1 Tax=Deinococcus sp. KSM4-11 TaxID=2568654 RepID=UPI0010A30E30|nr:glycoside hydrolase family 15 protein [Deinococcus sp. KSM4-11]THF85546.1 glycoside hydrolase family 15 protein [Deinococcus sp. KSM4-11]